MDDFDNMFWTMMIAFTVCALGIGLVFINT